MKLFLTNTIFLTFSKVVDAIFISLKNIDNLSKKTRNRETMKISENVSRTSIMFCRPFNTVKMIKTFILYIWTMLLSTLLNRNPAAINFTEAFIVGGKTFRNLFCKKLRRALYLYIFIHANILCLNCILKPITILRDFLRKQKLCIFHLFI